MSQFPVAILIPVYNAFSDAFECLESIKTHTPEDVPVHVIDDASTQGDFEIYLKDKGFKREHFTIQRNSENLGFLKTVNKGFDHLGNSDVLLLNSDTLVTHDWSLKLREAAYSRTGIGTVTPLTNNGVVASFPHFYEDNTIPAGYSLSEFASLVARVSEKVRPEIPSCVGFCVYLKREMLQACGGFDEETFENGYGEENDLSRRMRRYGYTDILDDSTYIYHKGCASFGATKDELVQSHTKILQKRYPDYFEDVRRFRAHNPLREVHARIEEELFRDWEKTHPKRILHILHNGPFKAYHFAPGGTELHVARLIEDEDEFAHFSLVYSDGTLCLTAHLPGWKKEFLLPIESMSFEELLQDKFFDLIHVHHFTPLTLPRFKEALLAHGNYYISLHDFTTGCPRNYLLTPALKLCNTEECTTSCGYSRDHIKSYREEALSLLEHAEKRFVFSKSSEQYMQKIFGTDLSYAVVPHGTIPLPSLYANEDLPESAPDVFRIVVPGKLARHKGSEILKKLLKHTTIPGTSTLLEWHIVGDELNINSTHIVSHGAYTYETLPDVIRDISPHIALFLSVAPETYGMTVDEQLRLGIPVVVPPQGAPAERVLSHGAGIILDELSEEAVLRVFERLLSDWTRYAGIFLKTCELEVTDYLQEVSAMKSEYRETLSGEHSGPESQKEIYRSLFQKSISHIKEKNPLRILVGKTLGTCVVLTERLGIRSNVESVFQRVLPGPLKHKLKKARISTL